MKHEGVQEVREDAAALRPLVTFALIAYNQEQFIRDAIDGALAQTYSPLEIILSDDYSTDRTFEIMQSVAAAYRGPHSIVLNSNSCNVGIARHVNRIMKLAKGGVVVIAAGDDISFPQRSEVTVTSFANNPGCTALYSSLLRIDENGREMGIQKSANRTEIGSISRAVVQWCPGVLGASHAWKRELFDYFGPLSPRVMTEDRALPLRAALLGEILVIDEPLVKYRVHRDGFSQMPTNVDRDHYFRRQSSLWRQTFAVIRGYEQDLCKFVKVSGGNDELNRAIAIVREQKVKVFAQWRFFSSSRRTDRLKYFIGFAAISRDWRQMARFLVLMVWPRIYLRKLARISGLV